MRVDELFESDDDHTPLQDMTKIPHCVKARVQVERDKEISFNDPAGISSWTEWEGENSLTIDVSAATKAAAIAGMKKIIDQLIKEKSIRPNVKASYQLARRQKDQFSGHMVDLTHAGWTEIELK